MKNFDITPHEGVGPIKLGMRRREVVKRFGSPEFDGDYRVGYFGGFLIDFDDDDKVEFIELTNSDQFDATYKSKNLHLLKANEVVAFIEQEDSYDVNDPEIGYSYIFKMLQLCLWRGIVADNESDEKGHHFETVGIATGSYF